MPLWVAERSPGVEVGDGRQARLDGDQITEQAARTFSVRAPGTPGQHRHVEQRLRDRHGSRFFVAVLGFRSQLAVRLAFVRAVLASLPRRSARGSA